MGLGIVLVLQTWTWIVVAIMVVYAIRHWIFTLNRLTGWQRPYYQDLLDSDLPPVSIIVPMRNEDTVAAAIFDALVASNYPKDLIEIIPVDDQSQDDTTTIAYAYSQRYPFIKPIYNLQGERGKSNALNRALAHASNEIVLVFDADYTPGKDLVRELVMAFIDPEVGAVMGRVVPRNSSTSFMTRLLALERSGGYQVDQQARYNLDLFPQYGGTVGGFRRSVVIALGGFSVETLAEDTDLSARLFLNGWRISYANRAECYEEVPETWDARFTQLRRWAHGHNRAFAVNILPLLRSSKLSPVQKLDAALLLFIYCVPPILLSGIATNALLFFMGAIPFFPGILFAFFVVSYNAMGNFAPVFEVGAAEVLDGGRERLYLLPSLFYLFLFNSWAVTSGAIDAFGDFVKARRAQWDVTRHARQKQKDAASA
ncbi:MAG: glycosyltransferase family 2 protein [Vulcanimicrobiaceae bacterium]|jgi:cellulose synthase/poly-beta-1,6-N-acetylglucosamine synthase-like glycosyltransferase